MKDGTCEATGDAARVTHATGHISESEAQSSKALVEPKRNRRGGARNVRHGLTSGALPHGCSWIATLVRQFREGVERAVLDLRGEISLFDAACINTAARHEQHALLAQRWLRREAAELSPDQRLAFSREIGKASAERDRALRALGLDKRASDDPWAEVLAAHAESGRSGHGDADVRPAGGPVVEADDDVPGDWTEGDHG